MVSTQSQRNEIKEFIQTELLKRGFLAPIIQFEELDTKSGPRFEFKTEQFQTVPVIMKAIQVDNFGSSIRKEKFKREDGTEIEFNSFWISVHVSYEHFSGGTNGCKLFDVHGKFVVDDKEYERVWDLKVE